MDSSGRTKEGGSGTGEGTGSLEEICTEAEFIPILLGRTERLIRLLGGIRNPVATADFDKTLYAALADACHDTESFLDDFDARGNRTFVVLTELVASLRGFASVGYTLEHVRHRFAKSYMRGADTLDVEFMTETTATLQFCEEAVKALVEAINEEWRSILGAEIAPSDVPRGSNRSARRKLPHNVDEEEILNEDRKIAEIAAQYAAAWEILDRESPRRPFPDSDAMKRFVLDHCYEGQCRSMEARIHNLQSKYDTFVKSTVLEARDPDLRRLRGFISVVLHLCESLTLLVHFYERHENDIRCEKTKERIAAVVNKSRVLDRIVNYALLYSHRYLAEGVEVARRVLARYTREETVALDLPSGIVLHARPASLIAKVVSHHGTPVQMVIGNTTCNAGSLMQVILAAGANPGARRVTFRGDHRPIRDLRILFESGLGDSGPTSLPEALAYLRR